MTRSQRYFRNYGHGFPAFGLISANLYHYCLWRRFFLGKPGLVRIYSLPGRPAMLDPMHGTNHIWHEISPFRHEKETGADCSMVCARTGANVL